MSHQHHDHSQDHDHSHSHSHSHGHGHGHSHGAEVSGKRFAISIGLNTIYVAFEIVFGLLAGSLALVADAAHNASDVLSLAAAWAAMAMARKPPSQHFTYGLKRSPILASLFNAALLALAIGVIAWQAIDRLIYPQPVHGVTVMWVAVIGLIVNTGTAVMLMKGSKEDLNVRGAFLHMVADAGVTLGVIVAGGLILLTGWQWLDPALSLAIVVVILWGTWGLARDSIKLALDAVPAGTDLQAIRDYLENLEGVNEVHDLHVWPMSTTETALTAHLVIPAGIENPDSLLQHASQGLHDHHKIEHATIQIEHGDSQTPCALAPAGVV